MKVSQTKKSPHAVTLTPRILLLALACKKHQIDVRQFAIAVGLYEQDGYQLLDRIEQASTKIARAVAWE
jgi:hypothetical protein